MEWKELQSTSAAELQRRLQEQREQLRDLRFRVSQGTEKNVAAIRSTRLAISRILTRLKQLESQPK
jgi:ribosomal protein L29